MYETKGVAFFRRAATGVWAHAYARPGCSRPGYITCFDSSRCDIPTHGICIVKLLDRSRCDQLYPSPAGLSAGLFGGRGQRSHF